MILTRLFRCLVCGAHVWSARPLDKRQDHSDLPGCCHFLHTCPAAAMLLSCTSASLSLLPQADALEGLSKQAATVLLFYDSLPDPDYDNSMMHSSQQRDRGGSFIHLCRDRGLPYTKTVDTATEQLHGHAQVAACSSRTGSRSSFAGCPLPPLPSRLVQPHTPSNA